MLDLMRADFGEPFEEGVSYPDWVIRCGKKVCPALFPKLYELKDSQDSLRNAYYIGLMRSMIEGAQLLLASVATELPPIPERELTPEENVKLSSALFGKDSGLLLPAEGDTLVPSGIVETLEENFPKFGLEEWGLYHAGMSDGCLMLAGRNASTVATNLYSTMLLYWRVVERLESVERLHAFLTKVHGQNVVGSDIKRTRQLCGRIGKRFAPPGRPKKLPHAPKPAK